MQPQEKHIPDTWHLNAKPWIHAISNHEIESRNLVTNKAIIDAIISYHHTQYPHIVCGNEPYKNGWREGSWKGFAETFSNPAPWYYRTLESWVTVLNSCGLQLQTITEPIHPTTKKPASLILIAGL